MIFSTQGNLANWTGENSALKLKIINHFGVLRSTRLVHVAYV